jgi:hypothetical protein
VIYSSAYHTVAGASYKSPDRGQRTAKIDSVIGDRPQASAAWSDCDRDVPREDIECAERKSTIWPIASSPRETDCGGQLQSRYRSAHKTLGQLSGRRCLYPETSVAPRRTQERASGLIDLDNFFVVLSARFCAGQPT